MLFARFLSCVESSKYIDLRYENGLVTTQPVPLMLLVAYAVSVKILRRASSLTCDVEQAKLTSEMRYRSDQVVGFHQNEVVLQRLSSFRANRNTAPPISPHETWLRYPSEAVNAAIAGGTCARFPSSS